MPVKKCSNQKYRIGDGKCIYKSKASAERAYAGYRAVKHMKEQENQDPVDIISMDVPLMIRLLELAREDLKTDVQIHQVAQRLIEKSKETFKDYLEMDDYTYIIQDLNKDQEDNIMSSVFEEILRLAIGKKIEGTKKN